MCGACGRTAVEDPTLGPVRTRRDMLVVAQLVNSASASIPGRPVVRVAGDAWVLVGATGTSLTCHTVEQLWQGLLDRSAGAPDRRSALTARLLLGVPADSPLADRVLLKGLEVLTDHSSAPAAAGHEP